ncbi:cytochrome c oxidase subunit 6C-1 [Thalassophryne amazonica]|uniref:cytochrome c oxidase subunit 6C-1 n=1 Tax=Thalassophryne amazonica TaxID=390379 RepID=UPI0014726AB4|nr:cytochrome c oxidase subunit 6C-1 [Thalassophryne amazonica]XP_034021845.1 cytochrome c oxidase subunit 6C-1 [Thalassophryne amazonica]
MSLPKPMMRGLLAQYMRIRLPLSFVFAGGLALAYKLFVADPRERAYDNFNKSYDPDKAFEAMREAGVFQSVRPVGK